ncbi:DUF2252 domain-containing protein [Actinomycetospora sp. TBRC 11914]|uniref:DUF2252 domain-containing protein n=1 Tax=Actinomycetospora sp. TBRC 11914 TaxID=2729387 RepID=UPI00145FC1D6|nr:DUF2252 domain-containing protein [Actinomycetospora sp. TBRC 11914]NMO94019.1 DUF2252 domain-containing protein [Actinomycetospora sp. TBRC 11914]
MTRTIGAPPRREQRVERGKAARAEVPRASHAEFTAGPDRPDPLTLLERQETSRIPELLPIRHARMAASPFAFFRGAALPMASDLARTPTTGLPAQICGDAHLANFGVFASPERALVFDINDFDETVRGPWEWDVKRLATSLEIASRHNDFAPKERRRIVLATVAAYRRAMRGFAGTDTLAVWYARAEADAIESLIGERLHDPQRKGLERATRTARRKDNLGALGRFARLEDGEARLVAEPPLIVPVRDLVDDATDREVLELQLREVLVAYRASLGAERRVLLDQYRLVDVARKVVGVGSVGTREWMVLLLGDDHADPLFLQAKEAEASVLERFVGASGFDNCGERVVVGQRLMQAVSDIFLGWARADGLDGRRHDYYIRQLRDWKGSADVETMVPKGMLAYGQICGWTLARAHARSGDRIALAAYLGGGDAFDVAVEAFARAYADQNERDHRRFVAAIAAGRLAADASP